MEDSRFSPIENERIAILTQQLKYYGEALERIGVYDARNDFDGINDALNEIADKCNALLNHYGKDYISPCLRKIFEDYMSNEALDVLLTNEKMSKYYREDKQ